MNIYCALKDDNKIKKVSISAKLQKTLLDYLNDSVSFFDKAEEINFSGEYKPDENQVLVIKGFPESHVKITPLSTEQLLEEEIKDIKYIFFKFDKKIAYQTFDNRKIIKPEKWFLIYSKKTFSKIDNQGLIIDSKIDALYLNDKKKLLFTSYHNASKIFNLTNYYRESSNSEIENFYKTDIFLASDSLTPAKFNSRMRKKIFLINKNNILNKVKDNFNIVYNYAKELRLEDMFDENNKKIKFPEDKKEIEKLVNFLNEDLFRSPISDSFFETNSKKKIN